MARAVVLFSGGLDSMLSVRILQRQGLDVDALNIRTVFSCCRAEAAQSAVAMGARLTVAGVADDYIDLIRRPKYGRGKGVNPCVDCRIYMCRMARRFMEETGACVVATGEIVGQRPMSQKRNDLKIIEEQSGLVGRLLRPLSAKLLPPTIAEQEGLIDREKLYEFQGRRRQELIALAEELGLDEAPTPSTGCALTETFFAPRVRDLMEHSAEVTRWDFDLLNHGRHFRFDPETKVVVGRNETENAGLRWLASQSTGERVALLEPDNFLGPDALVVGHVGGESLAFAAGLIIRYSRKDRLGEARVRITHAGEQRLEKAPSPDDVPSAVSL